MIADIQTAVGNLPAEPNSFIGRERDLTELAAMLVHVRALTLCGPGGIGKTRLAVRLAASVAASYPDGIWMADLADADLAEGQASSSSGKAPAATDPGLAGSQVITLVAAALGIRSEPQRQLADTITEALRPKSMLLILDTCEHLIEAAAEFVQRLLAGCPAVRVIATSREPLRVRGEVIWRVPPLSVPPAEPAGDRAGPAAGAGSESEAVRLFAERAAAVRPASALDWAATSAVADICRTLDGVPLAIELAAARVRALSLEQISSRLADRFELLALGDRTAPPRQQTLRATVEWSYELLVPAERLLLSRLSVFHGWSLEMAEQVCSDEQIPAADILDILTALIDKSLVSMDGEVNGNARYRLLDTVREVAAEQASASGEMALFRSRHRDCTLALAEQIAGKAFVRGDPPWPARVLMYHRVRADRANISLALAYCVQHDDAEEGLRLCHALAGSFLASGEAAEGADWIDRMLAIRAGVAPGVRARALAVRAELAFELQDYPGARDYARACLDLSQGVTDGNPASAWRLLALVDLMTGHPAEGLAQAETAVAAARQMADAWEEGVALASRAAAIASLGELAAAETAYHQALDVLRDNNGWGVANVLHGLGQVARARRDAEGALRYFRDALTIYGQIDARPEMARCLAGMGWTALAQHDLTAARESLTQSMRLSLATGHRLAIARGLRALAALAAASGELAQAVILTGTALSLFEAIGTMGSVRAGDPLDALLTAARSNLGPDETDTLLASGRQLSPYQAALLAGQGRPAELPASRADLPAGSPVPAAPGPAAIPGAPAPGSAPGVLTGREREVAALVVRGLTNRAIGQQLFISEATAARHVANIFGKLGFTSRAQLVAWMAGQEPDGSG